MYVIDYQYSNATVDCGDHKEIAGVSRDANITQCYLPTIDRIVLTKRTAVLYVGGFSIHQSETCDLPDVDYHYNGSLQPTKSSMVIKESTVHSLHKWVGAMEHNKLVVYANINSNTCASSMHSIYEAEKLLADDVCDEVIIIAEERTSSNTLRIFKEHRVDVVCSDGFAVIRLGRVKAKNTRYEITDSKWAYEFNRNPFQTTVSGYSKVNTEAKCIKPHGTDTVTDLAAEVELVKDRDVIKFKDEIGHSQGASGLLEICLLMDRDLVTDSTLCVSSGLGGYYGSCVLRNT